MIRTIPTWRSAEIFCVGTTYNGLLLDRILDQSIDSDALYFIYRGYTATNEIVFEAMNAPTVAKFEMILNLKKGEEIMDKKLALLEIEITTGVDSNKEAEVFVNGNKIWEGLVREAILKIL